MQGSLPTIQFPVQLFLYAIPCAIYALVRRLRGATWSQIASSLGLQKSRPVYYVWALAFFVVVGVLSLVTIYVFFPGYYDRPGGAASQYAGWISAYSPSYTPSSERASMWPWGRNCSSEGC